MSAIIPFDFGVPATAPARRRESSLNQDLILNRGFPVLSIKGKVFAISKDNERKVLTRMIDDEQVPVSSLQLTVIRANAKSRVFYGKAYVEGDSDGAKPACFSHDGVAPDAGADQPQAKNCQLCPHAQWGTKMSTDGTGGKGTACTVNTRLAVADPKALDTVYLLRVPAGSRTNFSDAVKTADSHGKDYNEVVMRIGFDAEAPSPKLTFRPSGILGDEAYAKVQSLFDDATVLDIVGVPTVRMAQEVEKPALPAPEKAKTLPPAPAPAPKPVVTEDELEGALSGEVEAPAPAPRAAPRKTAAKPPAPAPAAAPAADDDVGGLLGDLASLLGGTDD